MDESVSKGINIGTVVIVALIIISLVVGLVMLGSNFVNQGTEDLESTVSRMSDSKYTAYDQVEVSGSKIGVVIDTFSDDDIAIIVRTTASEAGTNLGGYNYGMILDGYSAGTTTAPNLAYSSSTTLAYNAGGTYYVTAPDTTTTPTPTNANVKPMDSSGTETYVRDNAKFLAELIKDESDTIIGICFTQTA